MNLTGFCVMNIMSKYKMAMKKTRWRIIYSTEKSVLAGNASYKFCHHRFGAADDESDVIRALSGVS